MEKACYMYTQTLESLYIFVSTFMVNKLIIMYNCGQWEENRPFGAPDSADEDNFLSDTDRNVEMLNHDQYQRIPKDFVKYNTVLPSSAPVYSAYSVLLHFSWVNADPNETIGFELWKKRYCLVKKEL